MLKISKSTYMFLRYLSLFVYSWLLIGSLNHIVNLIKVVNMTPAEKMALKLMPYTCPTLDKMAKEYAWRFDDHKEEKEFLFRVGK